MAAPPGGGELRFPESADNVGLVGTSVRHSTPRSSAGRAKTTIRYG
jgi:hypothetical protein